MTKTAIIAGTYKGTPLKTSKRRGIRPTLTKVRKSIFDILSSVEGKKVLDLYAGSGTLGLEALSRGASFVTFVDRNAQAIRIIRQNSKPFDLRRISVVRDDSMQFLRKQGEQFDIIFADPPYGKADLSRLRRFALARLNGGGTLIVESSVRDRWNDEHASVKRYGDTQISIFWRGSLA